MKQNEFMDKLCEFARTKMSAKAKTPTVQFLLGAGSIGIGRKVLEDKISSFLPYCTDENGDIDINGLKTSILGGFEASKTFPVMGGLISLDAEDAKEFFSFIGSPCQQNAVAVPNVQTPPTTATA